MSEIKTLRCDRCFNTEGRFLTLYVRTKVSPWFGERRDYCESCADPIANLVGIDSATLAAAFDAAPHDRS